jgi:hypothetical protein
MEHMVKLQVFGNNSKTVNNIKNMTWGKNDQHNFFHFNTFRLIFKKLFRDRC